MKYFSLLLSSLLLVACGGGGSGGGGGAPAGPVASTSTFALKQAYTNNFLDTAAYSATVSGSLTFSTANPPASVSGTIGGTASVSQSAIAATTFDGVAAQSKTRTPSGTITVTVNGTSASQSLPTIPTTQHVSGTFDLLGLTSPATVLAGVPVPASFAAAASPIVFPASARVGDSGTAGIVNSYASSAKGSVLSTTTITYALEADTATTAILRLMQTGRNAAGEVTSTQFETNRITPAGAITRLQQEIRVTITANGTTLDQLIVFTY